MSGRDVVSDTDVCLIAAALRPAYPDGIPEPVLRMAVSWVATTRVNAALVKLMLDGELEFMWSGQRDDWVFRRAAA